MLKILFRLRLLVILLSFYSAQGLFTHSLIKTRFALICAKFFWKIVFQTILSLDCCPYVSLRTSVSIMTKWENSNLLSWNVNIIKQSVKFQTSKNFRRTPIFLTFCWPYDCIPFFNTLSKWSYWQLKMWKSCFNWHPIKNNLFSATQSRLLTPKTIKAASLLSIFLARNLNFPLYWSLTKLLFPSKWTTSYPN